MSQDDIWRGMMQAEMDRRFAAVHREVDQRFTAIQREADQRFDASKDAVGTAMTAAEKAVKAALDASKEATGKAEHAADKRFDSVNEFRQQLLDQANSFVTKDTYDAVLGRVDKLENAGFITAGKEQGIRADEARARTGLESDYYRAYKSRANIAVAVSVLMAVIAVVSVMITVLH